MKLASTVARASSALLFFFLLLVPARSNDPFPNPDSVVQIGRARFTILTSHLIRMEWGNQVDAATFVFVNRNLPKPDFSVSTDQGWHVIETSAVKVRIDRRHYLNSHCLLWYIIDFRMFLATCTQELIYLLTLYITSAPSIC